MIIGSDVDDVIYPWYNTAHSICEKAGLTNGITPTRWAVHEDYQCPKEVWIQALVDAGSDLYFADPMPGALEALNDLAAVGDLVFITARGSFGPNGEQIKGWTRDWFDYWNIPGELVFSPDKTVRHTDYFIDDRADHVEDLMMRRPGTRSYLHDQPWNRDAEHLDFARLKSISEYAKIIQGIHG